jgi:2'-5' RNA ligase
MTRTIIASLAEARAALEAARSSGVAAELESPPDAASIYGVLWFAELNRALLKEFPGLPFSLALDCGNCADLAHAALAEGIKRIRFSGHPEAAKALRDIARQLGAEVVDERLYVIALPTFAADDLAWIEQIRQQHDPQGGLVGPHFTLVFATPPSQKAALVSRVQEAATRCPPFSIEMDTVEVFAETASDHYIFLMPADGSSELVQLHEGLRLESGNRSYKPHLTVGRLAHAGEARQIAEELEGARRTIRGRVTALRVIAVSDNQARDILTVELKGH